MQISNTRVPPGDSRRTDNTYRWLTVRRIHLTSPQSKESARKRTIFFFGDDRWFMTERSTGVSRCAARDTCRDVEPGQHRSALFTQWQRRVCDPGYQIHTDFSFPHPLYRDWR